jgi:cobaltochelatase CobN
MHAFKTLLWWLLAGSVLYGQSRNATAVMPAASSVSTSSRCIAYIGVWDRSEPMLAELTPKIGFTPVFAEANEIFGVDGTGSAAFGPCEIDFVLNLTTEDAVRLRKLFESTASAVPNRKIFALDARASQAELQNARLLVPDTEIPKYWRANGETNVTRLLNYIMIRYFGAKGDIQPPVDIPDAGFYDPSRENDSFPTFASYKAFKISRGRWKEGAPVVALLTQQSFWITHDTKVLAAEVYALERHGINPVVIFGDREQDIHDMLVETHPDGIIEDRHGAMWDSPDLLDKLDVPYFRPISMLAYTVDQWKADPQGLNPRDVGMFMTLQESWGTIEPVVVGGLHAAIPGLRMHDPVPDGVERFAARVASTLRLRTEPEQEKKIAIVFPSAGIGKSDLMRGTPTGMYLDGPASLMKFLPEMKRRGYTVDSLPKDTEDLVRLLEERDHNVGSWNQKELEDLVDHGDPVLVPAEQYQRWFHQKLSPENQEKMLAAYGPPPGKFMVVERNGAKFIVLPRLQFGNVVVMPQPARGQTEDYTLVHSRDVPPPHNYLAFYWWLQESFKADAVIHWGTHGTLEMLPGKEAGMAQDDWTAICIGNMPNIDLWIMDNLAEATLARRRSYAVIVDHMVPPAVNAGLGNQFRAINDDIDKFDTLENGMIKQRYRVRISDEARKERIDETLKFPRTGRPFTDDQIKAVAAYLEQLDEAKVPLTLHVLGEPPERKYLGSYLTSIAGTEFLKHLEASDPPVHDASDFARRARLRAEGEKLIQEVVLDNGQPSRTLTPDLKKDLDFSRQMLIRLNSAGEEIDGLFRALDGRYVHPGPGPEPIRNPASVPAGRDLYALNPEEIPTRPAWDTAVTLIDEFLKAHKVRKVGMDLNGMDTMRDFGVMEGQILYLMGVRPVWDRNDLAYDVEVIPHSELKRPRIDVFIAMGGLYKENFPSRVRLLDKAVHMVSALDEPDNYVREGTLANERKFEKAGVTPEIAKIMATARIFGTKPGDESGTNILYLVPNTGYWQKKTELTDVYIDHMSYVYTQGLWGKKVPGLYEQNIQGTQALIRVWASNMSSQLSNHHAYEYLGGLSMAVKQLTGKEPPAYIADVRDPDGARMRDFDEVLQTDFRTQLLNPNWVKGMEEHGYAGTGQVSELVTNTFGWAVTRKDSVSDATWKEIDAVYFKDKYKLGTRAWMEKSNPHAMQDIAARLIEASHRGLWHADRATLRELAQTWQTLVLKYGASGGQLSDNNAGLKQYIAENLAASGDEHFKLGTAPGLGKLNAAGRMAARTKAAANAAAARLNAVTGQLLSLQQEVAHRTSSQRPTPLPQRLSILALFINLLLAFALLAAGYAGRRGAL